VVAHEAVHAARAAFNEPGFEEFFAHGSGPRKWRRVLGPLVKRPWEVWVAMGGMVGALLFEPLAFAVTCLIGAAFIRLIRQHQKLTRAFRTLLVQIGDEGKVRAALFRMTDREIELLSRGMKLKGDETLRWRLIRSAYINDGS
jgi:hypothetical protein